MEDLRSNEPQITNNQSQENVLIENTSNNAKNMQIVQQQHEMNEQNQQFHVLIDQSIKSGENLQISSNTVQVAQNQEEYKTTIQLNEYEVTRAIQQLLNVNKTLQRKKKAKLMYQPTLDILDVLWNDAQMEVGDFHKWLQLQIATVIRMVQNGLELSEKQKLVSLLMEIPSFQQIRRWRILVKQSESVYDTESESESNHQQKPIDSDGETQLNQEESELNRYSEDDEKRVPLTDEEMIARYLTSNEMKDVVKIHKIHPKYCALFEALAMMTETDKGTPLLDIATVGKLCKIPSQAAYKISTVLKIVSNIRDHVCQASPNYGQYKKDIDALVRKWNSFDFESVIGNAKKMDAHEMMSKFGVSSFVASFIQLKYNAPSEPAKPVQVKTLNRKQLRMIELGAMTNASGQALHSIDQLAELTGLSRSGVSRLIFYYRQLNPDYRHFQKVKNQEITEQPEEQKENIDQKSESQQINQNNEINETSMLNTTTNENIEHKQPSIIAVQQTLNTDENNIKSHEMIMTAKNNEITVIHFGMVEELQMMVVKETGRPLLDIESVRSIVDIAQSLIYKIIGALKSVDRMRQQKFNKSDQIYVKKYHYDIDAVVQKWKKFDYDQVLQVLNNKSTDIQQLQSQFGVSIAQFILLKYESGNLLKEQQNHRAIALQADRKSKNDIQQNSAGQLIDQDGKVNESVMNDSRQQKQNVKRAEIYQKSQSEEPTQSSELNQKQMDNNVQQSQQLRSKKLLSEQKQQVIELGGKYDINTGIAMYTDKQISEIVNVDAGSVTLLFYRHKRQFPDYRLFSKAKMYGYLLSDGDSCVLDELWSLSGCTDLKQFHQLINDSFSTNYNQQQFDEITNRKMEYLIQKLKANPTHQRLQFWLHKRKLNIKNKQQPTLTDQIIQNLDYQNTQNSKQQICDAANSTVSNQQEVVQSNSQQQLLSEKQQQIIDLGGRYDIKTGIALYTDKKISDIVNVEPGSVSLLLYRQKLKFPEYRQFTNTKIKNYLISDKDISILDELWDICAQKPLKQFHQHVNDIFNKKKSDQSSKVNELIHKLTATPTLQRLQFWMHRRQLKQNVDQNVSNQDNQKQNGETSTNATNSSTCNNQQEASQMKEDNLTQQSDEQESHQELQNDQATQKLKLYTLSEKQQQIIQLGAEIDHNTGIAKYTEQKISLIAKVPIGTINIAIMKQKRLDPDYRLFNCSSQQKKKYFLIADTLNILDQLWNLSCCKDLDTFQQYIINNMQIVKSNPTRKRDDKVDNLIKQLKFEPSKLQLKFWLHIKQMKSNEFDDTINAQRPINDELTNNDVHIQSVAQVVEKAKEDNEIVQTTVDVHCTESDSARGRVVDGQQFSKDNLLVTNDDELNEVYAQRRMIMMLQQQIQNIQSVQQFQDKELLKSLNDSNVVHQKFVETRKSKVNLDLRNERDVNLRCFECGFVYVDEQSLVSHILSHVEK